MRIILASTIVPFVNGGARFIVEWLEEKLREHGHDVERFYLPFLDDADHLLSQTAALRLMDLGQNSDRLIAFRPPAYVLRHPHKTVWFIHHIRAYYDLWDSDYGPPKTAPQRALRSALHRLDGQSLGEAKRIYTNSKVVADRLRDFNGIRAEPLYPPIYQPERFHTRGYGDEVVAICRFEPHKRQHLMIEAMRYTRTAVKLRLCGRSGSAEYARTLRNAISSHGLQAKVVLEDRWISETEKADLLSEALCAAYLPLDEDSYGYPSLEAAHAAKAVVTTADSGGVLELVEDRRNGFVCTPDPKAIAECFDALYRDRDRAKRFGGANLARIGELAINWDRVVTALTE